VLQKLSLNRWKFSAAEARPPYKYSDLNATLHQIL